MEEYKRNWLSRLLCCIAVWLVLAGTASAQQKTCQVSFSNLPVSRSEVIVSFEIDVDAGAIATVQNLPIGWYVVVDNDASWRTKIRANTTVGAASLTPEELRKVRLVVRKDETYLTFKLSGVVSVTTNYQREKRIKLKMADFVVTPSNQD